MPEPVQVEPVGDDQRWKRDVMRVISELVAANDEKESRIRLLEGKS
jgi:hypothetical protein